MTTLVRISRSLAPRQHGGRRRQVDKASSTFFLRGDALRRTTPRQQSTAALQWYSKKLKTHPLLTKAITSGAIAGSGDALCQWLTKKGKQESWWDWHGSARFAFLGFAYVAPMHHNLLNFLAKRFPGTSWKRVAQRVAGEQFVFTPISLPTWMTALWTLENDERSPLQNFKVYRQEMSETYPGVIRSSLALWTPLMAINFRWVPLKYQVLYTNVFQLLWNTYLSAANSDNDELFSSSSWTSSDHEESSYSGTNHSWYVKND